MLSDNINMVFGNEDEFLEFIKNYVTEGTWERTFSSFIKTKPVSEIDVGAFNELCDIKAFEDTVNNTGLYIIYDNKTMPVGKSAIKSLLARCRVSGNVFREMCKEDLSFVINKFLLYSNGDALIRISYNKVRAVLAGEQNGYSIINMFDVFNETKNTLKKDFEDSKFIQSSFTHENILGKWQINDKKITDSYREVFKDFSKKEIKGIVTICSSDTSFSGANIFLSLKLGDISIVLGEPLKLKHENGTSIDDFKQNLKMIFGKIKESFENIKKLEQMQIKHPNDCIINLAKRVGLGKKYVTAVLDYRKAVYKNVDAPVSAKEVYFDICSILAFVEGKTDIDKLNTEEKVSRILSLNITDFDVLQQL